MQIDLIAAAAERAEDEADDWDEEGEEKDGEQEVEQVGEVALWHCDILHDGSFLWNQFARVHDVAQGDIWQEGSVDEEVADANEGVEAFAQRVVIQIEERLVCQVVFG